MIEINLVPDIKQELLKAQRVRSTVITFAILIGIIAVGIVVALCVYIFAVQSVRQNIANVAIEDGSEQLLKNSDLDKTLTIQNQLTKISSLNANKKIDSRIFDVLAAIIPPKPNDVQISELTIDSDTSTITINGQASNSYAAVEVFKKTVEGAIFKYNKIDDKPNADKKELVLASDINTSDTSYGENSSGNKVLRFKLSFVYAEELFSPESTNVVISIKTNGNATDSYRGIPSSLFTAPAKDIPGVN